ncbi:cadmium resistance transporter, partial [Pediococcus acidilactici]
LPIYLAIKDDDDEVNATQSGASAVGTVLVTYLSVCTGCNLAIFLPVLMHAQLAEFFVALLLILGLSAVAVLVINLLSKNPFVSQVMEKYGEKLMKVCYVLIGLYVFWDSGLVTHLIRLVG